MAEQKVIQRLLDEQDEMKSYLAVLSKETQISFQEADLIHNEASNGLHQLQMLAETLRAEVRNASEACRVLEQKISILEQENTQLEHRPHLSEPGIVEHLPEETFVLDDASDSEMMSC